MRQRYANVPWRTATDRIDFWLRLEFGQRAFSAFAAFSALVFSCLPASERRAGDVDVRGGELLGTVMLFVQSGDH